MTIEVLLQNIDDKLGTLISLYNTPAAAQTQQSPATDPLAGASSNTSEPPAKRGRGRPANTEKAAAAPQPAAQQTQAPAPAAVDPFAVGATESIPQFPARTLDEVRAALIVYQTANDQTKALKLLKDVTGADTLAQLKPEDHGKLFAAAIPAGKIEITDVRAVLVAANERVANSGIAVMNKHGAKTIQEITEDKFIAVIFAAHQVRP